MNNKILELIEKYLEKNIYLQKKDKKIIDDLRLIIINFQIIHQTNQPSLKQKLG